MSDCDRGVSSEIPDWSRERVTPKKWDPSKQLLKTIRSYQRWKKSKAPWAVLLRMYATLRNRFWAAVTGTDIPLNCQIKGGLVLPHPNGVVIHPRAEIGPNCMIFQQVTIGGSGKGLYPKLVGHVDVGAGAKILGGVTIGAHARIGANSVVLTDVPPYATAVGAPARIIEKCPDNDEIYEGLE